jgi:uncharacterized protein GlcG (DUF336 family)
VRDKHEAQAIFFELRAGQRKAVAFVKAEQARYRPIVATLDAGGNLVSFRREDSHGFMRF